jgi:hypothetical protein
VSNRVALGREALRSALQLRRSLAIAREEPVNVYDIASTIGVEVRFLDGPSLEGMFLRDPHPTVCLPSLNHRPRGRVSFSCAHEIGHFQLGHGTTVDEYLDGDADSRPRTDEEFAADTFASSLLMPRQAVVQRFRVRNISPSDADPLVLFAIAGELDVGYQTLLKHMRFGLELVGNDWLHDRLRTSPKQVRSLLPCAHDARRLVIAGQFWPGLPIDLEVGDCIATSAASSLSVPPILTDIGTDGIWRTFRASKPGTGRLAMDGTPINIRAARFGYCGLLKYRFLEDPEAE